jgi:hypothetical protein
MLRLQRLCETSRPPQKWSSRRLFGGGPAAANLGRRQTLLTWTQRQPPPPLPVCAFRLWFVLSTWKCPCSLCAWRWRHCPCPRSPTCVDLSQHWRLSYNTPTLDHPNAPNYRQRLLRARIPHHSPRLPRECDSYHGSHTGRRPGHACQIHGHPLC